MRKKILCILLVFFLISSMAASALAIESESTNTMTISQAGIKFIEEFEGFSKYTYTDSFQWYIGYGTSCGAGEYPNGISEEEAEDLLRKALKRYEGSVNSFLGEYDIEVTQCQFDALISFTYNLSTNWMNFPNTIRSYLINGIENYTDMEIVNAMGIWCHVGKEASSLLIERRMEEANLFLYSDYGEDDAHHDYSYIIFNAGGGSIEHDVYFFEYGQPYGELPEAELNGYVFSGWYTSSGKQINLDEMAGENLTVYASWSRLRSSLQG